MKFLWLMVRLVFVLLFALLCYLACYGGVGSGVGGGGWRGLPPFACVEKEREVPAIFVWGGTGTFIST